MPGSMRLWHLWRRGVVGSGEVSSLVVRAASLKRARELAAENCGVEGPDSWTDPGRSRCWMLSVSGREQVLSCGSPSESIEGSGP